MPDSWWTDLAAVLDKVSVAGTDRVAVRQQYMDRAIPEFVGIPAPAAPCWTTAHGDLHWVNRTAPLRILYWESWGSAPALGSPAGLAAESTVCAELLQTVARGENLALEAPLQAWVAELRRRCPSP
ncbi:hypothetical protein [Streptomyces sp. NPDC056948]|uniref:hypothetical protein n=1 Tax=Streptomyces sp. NPDC056948 TaxID=3345975 RepID=UPI00363CB1FC